MSTERILRARSHVKTAIDQDGAVLLDLKRGTYFSLNGVAVDIWRCLEAGTTVTALRATLGETYDVPPATLDADVSEFVDGAIAAELVDVEA